MRTLEMFCSKSFRASLMASTYSFNTFSFISMVLSPSDANGIQMSVCGYQIKCDTNIDKNKLSQRNAHICRVTRPEFRELASSAWHRDWPRPATTNNELLSGHRPFYRGWTNPMKNSFPSMRRAQVKFGRFTPKICRLCRSSCSAKPFYTAKQSGSDCHSNGRFNKQFDGCTSAKCQLVQILV